MIGVKPLFSGRSLGEGETATFDVILAAPDGKTLARQRPALRAAQGRVALSVVSPRRLLGLRADQADAPRRRRPARRRRRQAGPHRGAGAVGPLPARSVEPPTPNGPVTSVAFDAGWYTEATADTPDMLEIALDKPEYRPGETMTVAVTARTAGRVTLNVIGDRLISSIDAGGAAGHAAHARAGRPRLGQRRLCGRDLAPAARRQGAAHAGPRDRRAMVLDRPPGARRWRST